MNFLPINDILIAADRQRQEFDQDYLNELKEDIEENGLFNAIVVRAATVEGASHGGLTEQLSEGMFLVQGECRLRAIRDIYDLGGTFRYDGQPVPPGMVPTTTLGELSPVQAGIAELHENVKRRNLTWQEHAAAVSRLAKLRAQQAEANGDAPPTVAAIAEEVRGSKEGYHHGVTREELIVAKHLDDPEVKAAPTLKEAVKVLKKKEQQAKNEVLAAEVGRTFSAELHTILHEDSAIWLETCPAEKFDVILTDPLYGVGADQFGDGGGAAEGAHGYKDDEESFLAANLPFVKHAYRVAKLQAHLYVFCDIKWFFWWRDNLGLNSGWWVHRTPLIWDKVHGARVPWPEHGPRRQYELILYAVKGKKPTTGVYPDVLRYPADANMGHSAQKPVALYADLLRRSVRPGDHVLDPFAGSGPILPAAHQMKVTATAIEKDASNYALCIRRAEGLRESPELNLEELLK